MGNLNRQIDFSYSTQYGEHVKNTSKGIITKYYSLSLQSQIISFQALVKKYQNKQIPTIVPIIQSSQIQSQQFDYPWKLDFKYFPNILQQQISNHKANSIPFSEKQILHLIDCVLSGLLLFSQVRLYHGDVRPSTIFCTQTSLQQNKPKQNLYLVSLPLLTNSKSLQKSSSSSKQDLYYLSPQYLNEISEDRKKPKSYEFNDIFSLGMIALEMGTLCEVSDFYDVSEFKIDFEKISKKLYLCHLKYSLEFCKLIEHMLQSNFSVRCRFYDAYTELNELLLKKYGDQNPQFFTIKDSSLRKNVVQFPEDGPSMPKSKTQRVIEQLKQKKHRVEQEIFQSSFFVSEANTEAWNKFELRRIRKNAQT